MHSINQYIHIISLQLIIFLILFQLCIGQNEQPPPGSGEEHPHQAEYREPFSGPLDPSKFAQRKQPPNMDFFASRPATLPGKKHPSDHMEKELTREEIVAQLKSQGVGAANIEQMADDILKQHKMKNIEKNDEDTTLHHDQSHGKGQKLNDVSMDDDNHPLATANLDLLPQPVLRKNFNKADVDGDGKLYIEELRAHFQAELDRVDIEKFKIRLAKVGGNPEAYDGERGDMLLKQAKKHLYREIKGVDEGFAAADTDKDGYIKFKEYVRLMQYESEKAIIRAKEQQGGDMEDEFSNWRNEL